MGAEFKVRFVGCKVERVECTMQSVKSVKRKVLSFFSKLQSSIVRT